MHNVPRQRVFRVDFFPNEDKQSSFFFHTYTEVVAKSVPNYMDKKYLQLSVMPFGFWWGVFLVQYKAILSHPATPPSLISCRLFAHFFLT